MTEKKLGELTIKTSGRSPLKRLKSGTVIIKER
jgi:hypothetical protein